MTDDNCARPAFLDHRAAVPIDRPFTRAEAAAEGVNTRRLRAWLDGGLLHSPLRGVYHVAQLPDDLALRAACLRLVAPPEAVITDHTAGWLHGASMILLPGDHLAVPKVSMFLPPGHRLRNRLAESGERTFLPQEVVELEGLRVTSPLRTMCDLGRSRNSDRGFGSMESVANVPEVDLEEFVQLATGPRFRGYRGVLNLRAWAPHVRKGVQSQAESTLRKRWIACPALPYPEPQVPVEGPRGRCYLDMGNEEIRYGAEYDGEEWHGPQQHAHDQERRDWFAEREGWLVDVFRKSDLYGPSQNVEARLHAGVAEARRRRGSSAWHGQDHRPRSAS